MGKYNEIQEQTTQSWGSNSFTTTVKEDTVEFDSAKDKFTFKDPIDAPSLTINGEPVGPSEPQQQADWNQNDDTKADYIKNRICYEGVGFTELFCKRINYKETVGDWRIYEYDGDTFAIETDQTYDVIKEGTKFTNLPVLTFLGVPAIVNGDMTNPTTDDFAIITDTANSKLLLYVPSNQPRKLSLIIDGVGSVVHKIDQKFINNQDDVYDYTKLGDPSDIKGGLFYNFETLPIDTDTKAIIVDFTDISASKFKKTSGLFTAEASTIGFKSTTGGIVTYFSNLTALEENEDYYFDFTLFTDKFGVLCIAAIFTKIQY